KNEASLTQLRSKRDKLQITINTAKAKINAANLALTKILKAYEEAKQAAIASDSYVTGKQAKVGTIKQKIHDLTAQISSLHSQLEAINQDAQTAKDQLTQAKVATLKKDLWTAQQTLNDYEEQLEVARQQLEQAQQTQLNAAANLITAKKIWIKFRLNKKTQMFSCKSPMIDWLFCQQHLKPLTASRLKR
ncbi:hypothetical protein PY97_07050, partial [Lacticaseibacillus rhamnosus]